MALDGWSLDQKINKLRDELVNEMRELKVHFAVLYEYMKKMEEKPAAKKEKKKKVLKD